MQKLDQEVLLKHPHNLGQRLLEDVFPFVDVELAESLPEFASMFDSGCGFTRGLVNSQTTHLARMDGESVADRKGLRIHMRD